VEDVRRDVERDMTLCLRQGGARSGSLDGEDQPTPSGKMPRPWLLYVPSGSSWGLSYADASLRPQELALERPRASGSEGQSTAGMRRADAALILSDSLIAPCERRAWLPLAY
jgi:hypothetical protein